MNKKGLVMSFINQIAFSVKRVLDSVRSRFALGVVRSHKYITFDSELNKQVLEAMTKSDNQLILSRLFELGRKVESLTKEAKANQDLLVSLNTNTEIVLQMMDGSIEESNSEYIHGNSSTEATKKTDFSIN